MDENEPSSQTLFPHETGHGHHRSARERQRKGPMWGCLKAIAFIGAGGLLLLFLMIGGGWWYVGSKSFADLVAKRIAETLKARLGREVSIGLVVFDRAHLRQVVLKDLRISNSPGAANPYFAGVVLNVVPAPDGWSNVIVGRSGYESRRISVLKYSPDGPRDTGIVYSYGC